MPSLLAACVFGVCVTGASSCIGKSAINASCGSSSCSLEAPKRARTWRKNCTLSLSTSSLSRVTSVSRASTTRSSESTVWGALAVFGTPSTMPSEPPGIDREQCVQKTCSFRSPPQTLSHRCRQRLDGMRCMYAPGYRFSKAGVILVDLLPASMHQGSRDFEAPTEPSAQRGARPPH